MAERNSTSQDISEISPTIFEFLRLRATELRHAGDNARSLLKTNLIIIGLFLPILASLFSSEFSPEKVFNNSFTQFGLFIWILSTLLVSIVYHRTRKATASHIDPIQSNIAEISSSEDFHHDLLDVVDRYSGWIRNVNILITLCTLLSLSAATLFAVGVLVPFVSFQPNRAALILISSIIILGILSIVAYKMVDLGVNIRQILSREKKGFDDLSYVRQQLLKKIYVMAGEDPFTLSEISGSNIDESHVFYHDVKNVETSEYLLQKLVRDGFFEKSRESRETTVIPPTEIKDIPYGEIEPYVDEAYDLLGRRLEGDEEACSAVADELGIRSQEIFGELESGNTSDKIQRYNVLVRRLREAGFDDIPAEFDISTGEVVYIPTEQAQEAYGRLEDEEGMREYEEQLAEERAEIARAENTINYIVVEPADEFGEIQVVTHDIKVPEDYHEWFYVSEADVSDAEREYLRQLEAGDEVRLITKTHPRTMEDVIAEVVDVTQ